MTLTQASVLKAVRTLHLYLGLFIAPALIFFAFTGALQTFSLHQATKGGAYKPANWIVALAQLHKKQTLQVQPQRPEKSASGPADSRPQSDHPMALADGTDRPLHNAMPLKIFFLIVCVGLVVSTLSGLYMSYKYSRKRMSMSVALIAGVIVPVVCSVL